MQTGNVPPVAQLAAVNAIRPSVQLVQPTTSSITVPAWPSAQMDTSKTLEPTPVMPAHSVTVSSAPQLRSALNVLTAITSIQLEVVFNVMSVQLDAWLVLKSITVNPANPDINLQTITNVNRFVNQLAPYTMLALELASIVWVAVKYAIPPQPALLALVDFSKFLTLNAMFVLTIVWPVPA